MRMLTGRSCGLLWLMVTAALFVSTNSQGLELLVYNTNNNGAGSLRQAITDNNGLGGGNTIRFTNTISGRLLVVGELVISTNVTIIGPGADVLRLDGNGSNRVFNITGGTASISGLTITNGVIAAHGAGIRNSGDLLISDCAFLANKAIDDYGGGAIYSVGTLAAVKCSFVENWTIQAGGALRLLGSSQLTNCTIWRNTASLSSGGGIYNEGQLILDCCTVVSNMSLFVGSGLTGANISIRNSIVARNFSTLDNRRSDVNGACLSFGYNLIGEYEGSSGWGAVGDQLGTTNSPINPNLHPLGYYGGPTPTAPPMPGSPAIDQGKSSGIATDQRGRPRTYDNPGIINATLGDGTDIGAVELGTASYVVTTTNDSGEGSLRTAISSALPGETVTVTFAPNVTNVITLTSGQLKINGIMTVLGPGADKLRISGNDASRVLLLSGGNTSISGLTFANGLTNDGAGILVQGGSHILDSCQVLSNSISAFGLQGGGVLTSSNAVLTLLNTAIAFNQARFSGGGISHTSSGLLSMTNCTVSNNRLTEIPDILTPRGGGIFMGTGTMNLTSCTVSSNSSSGGGGGIANNPFTPGTINICNSIVADNTSLYSSIDVEGAFVSGGYDLIGVTNLSTGFGAVGDQFNANPMLGPLGNYGGPTLTMALRSGSPAIDKGKNFGTPNDQRGFSRTHDDPDVSNAASGDGTDVGAFEVNPVLRIVDFERGGSNIAMSLMTVLGRSYSAEYTEDLSGASWTSFTNAPGNGYLLWTTNYSGGNQSKRFFRGVHTD